MQLSLHEELDVMFKLDGKLNTVYSRYPICKNCAHDHRRRCSLYKRTIRVLVGKVGATLLVVVKRQTFQNIFCKTLVYMLNA